MNETTFNRRQEIVARLQACILAVEKALTDRRTWTIKKQSAQETQNIIENRLKIELSEETIDGKKRYTNQEQREAALNNKLLEDREYKIYKQEYIESMIKLSEIDDALELLKMKFRAAQTEADLEQCEV